MNKIRPLSEQLTNMIAAGEVVERPFGVLKELIENSIDALATQIHIEIKNGGLDLIRVVDNGTGIAKEDIPLAFQRHATSKIFEEHDLKALTSLGFRGEALPSIASVSQVEMISKTEDNMGYCYNVRFGDVVKFELVQANLGTSVQVTGLFYKQPARLKYLKNPRMESAQCLSLVQSFALGNPQIAFTYISDNNELLKTTGSSDLSQILYQIYGYEVTKAAVEFEGESFDFKIKGVYVLPTIQRASRNYVHIFLNNRMIRYYKLSQSIFEVFHHYMPSNRYPIMVLFIETDPQLVDVNVHPSKWEIRLSNELQLLDLIQATVRESLRLNMGAKQIRPSIVKLPNVEQTLDLSISVSRLEVKETEKEDLAEVLKEEKKPQPGISMRAIGQHHGNYILAEDDENLYLIDQHAAMERIQYENIRRQFDDHKYHNQPLLLPLVLKNQQDIVSNWSVYKSILEVFGLFFEPFGVNSLILREVPSWLAMADTENFLYSLLDLLTEQKDLSISEFLKDTIATMACHSSVRFNEFLNIEQMNHLIRELLACDNPFMCPHGRPTYVSLQAKALLKEFGR